MGVSFARLAPQSVVTGKLDFANQGHSRILLKNKGLLHLYADIDSSRLLGAQMVGPAVEHLSHLLAWAVQQQMTIEQMLEMPSYHSVIEEGLRMTLKDARSKLDRFATWQS